MTDNFTGIEPLVSSIKNTLSHFNKNLCITY